MSRWSLPILFGVAVPLVWASATFWFGIAPFYILLCVFPAFIGGVAVSFLLFHSIAGTDPAEPVKIAAHVCGWVLPLLAFAIGWFSTPSASGSAQASVGESASALPPVTAERVENALWGGLTGAVVPGPVDNEWLWVDKLDVDYPAAAGQGPVILSRLDLSLPGQRKLAMYHQEAIDGDPSYQVSIKTIRNGKWLTMYYKKRDEVNIDPTDQNLWVRMHSENDPDGVHHMSFTVRKPEKDSSVRIPTQKEVSLNGGQEVLVWGPLPKELDGYPLKWEMSIKFLRRLPDGTYVTIRPEDMTGAQVIYGQGANDRRKMSDYKFSVTSDRVEKPGALVIRTPALNGDVVVMVTLLVTDY